MYFAKKVDSAENLAKPAFKALPIMHEKVATEEGSSRPSGMQGANQLTHDGFWPVDIPGVLPARLAALVLVHASAWLYSFLDDLLLLYGTIIEE